MFRYFYPAKVRKGITELLGFINFNKEATVGLVWPV